MAEKTAVILIKEHFEMSMEEAKAEIFPLTKEERKDLALQICKETGNTLKEN